MRCNRFIGETLVRARVVAFRRVGCLQLLLYTKNKFLATGTLVSLLMKAGLSLNVFWQGTSKPLLRVDLSSFMFKTIWLRLFGLTFFLEILFLVTI